ncbi:hypothetical protein DFH11DRAFT_740573 [Phellopilus nigrolimitatus]|nr:hypothetical protein DFH11DRAFT_740573 [Phellopilus nigrolimitatus]
MKLFDGTACFSPTVSPTAKIAWATHGGKVAVTLEEKQDSQWFFCSGMGDPWLTERLSMRPIIVFHVNWVLATVLSSFMLPLTSYVLDARYDSLNRQTSEEAEDLSAKEAQGSRPFNSLQKDTGTNAQSVKCLPDSSSTRLTSLNTVNPGHFHLGKRLRASSPAQYFGLEDHNRAQKKRKLPSPSVFVPTNSQLKTPSQLTPSQLSISTSSPTEDVYHFLPTALSSVPFSKAISGIRAQSDEKIYCLGTASMITTIERNAHEQNQLVKKPGVGVQGVKPESKFESPSSATSLSSVGSDTSFVSAPTAMPANVTRDIWGALMLPQAQVQATSEEKPSSTIGQLSSSMFTPTIRISDALGVLADLGECDTSGITLFVPGRKHHGLEFRVDSGDRRKTI